MDNKYFAIWLNDFEVFVKSLPEGDQTKINACITNLQSGDFGSLYIKTLRPPIKELIVNKYRFLFFINQGIIYFIYGFIKKTAKTPRKEIENAEKIYKLIMKK